MQLKELLKSVTILDIKGEEILEIVSLGQDSRQSNDVFVAIVGQSFDGHKFIETAIENCAKVIVCQEFPSVFSPMVTYVRVDDTTLALAIMAANFYRNPSEKLQLIGVTGTNGKTTTTTLLYHLFRALGYKVGLISTIAIYVDDNQFETHNTTPDVLTINKYLSQMVEQGVAYCFMEVSSHSVVQRRIEGLNFTGGVFTNLTHDHLDYHQTFASYRDAKKGFFDLLPKGAFALTNIDDRNGEYMLQNTQAIKKTYALKTYADYHLQIIENQLTGLVVRLQGQELWTQLIGEFNAYNLLCVYAVSHLLKQDSMQVMMQMSLLNSVRGRFEVFVSSKKITAIVDYAHTPDALASVLQTINTIRDGKQKLISVIGCGGNRDKAKRPVMAQIALKESSLVIFTSDNPRYEDPQEILWQMQQGVDKKDVHRYLVISDREQAIKTASTIAQTGDIVLVAGKGHETYQEVQGVRTYFDDMQQIRKYFQ